MKFTYKGIIYREGDCVRANPKGYIMPSAPNCEIDKFYIIGISSSSGRIYFSIKPTPNNNLTGWSCQIYADGSTSTDFPKTFEHWTPKELEFLFSI